MIQKIPTKLSKKDLHWAREALLTPVTEMGLSKACLRRLHYCGMCGTPPMLFDLFESAGSLNIFELEKFEEGVGPQTCFELEDALRKKGFINTGNWFEVDNRITWLYHRVEDENQGTAYEGEWYKFFFDEYNKRVDEACVRALEEFSKSKKNKERKKKPEVRSRVAPRK